MVILKFLIILLILITVHEFGHFIMAKIFGVYVKEFALGFGPKIFAYQGKETLFTIRALPLGGYAAMVGETGEEEDEDLADLPKERTLKGVNRFKQFLIMFAGAGMNLILAFAIFCGLAATTPSVNPDPIIGNVVENSPAQKAGLEVGDYVYKAKLGIHEEKISSYTELYLFLQNNKEGKEYQLFVKKDNKDKVLKITPEYDKDSKRYLSGLSYSVIEPSHNPIDVIKNGWTLSVGTVQEMFLSLGMIFSGKAGLDDVSGPIGMVKLTQQVQDNAGLAGLIRFTALLSVNLAIINLLPIPALDGGRILILIIESITRKEINPKLELILINGSFLILMGLIILISLNDVLKLFK